MGVAGVGAWSCAAVAFPMLAERTASSGMGAPEPSSMRYAGDLTIAASSPGMGVGWRSALFFLPDLVNLICASGQQGQVNEESAGDTFRL